MTQDRYSIIGRNGKSVIAERDGARYIGIDEFAQHIALDIIDDYRDITKQIDSECISDSTGLRNVSNYI